MTNFCHHFCCFLLLISTFGCTFDHVPPPDPRMPFLGKFEGIREYHRYAEIWGMTTYLVDTVGLELEILRSDTSDDFVFREQREGGVVADFEMRFDYETQVFQETKLDTRPFRVELIGNDSLYSWHQPGIGAVWFVRRLKRIRN